MLATSTLPTGTLQWMYFMITNYSDSFIKGTILTLEIAVVGTLIGFVLGYVLGIVVDLQINEDDGFVKKLLIKILKCIIKAFVEIFRGTPMIVQAMIIYYGLRQSGVEITSLYAGILVTLLNTGAYMSETVRGGIKAINIGQREGAYAMGMSPIATMFYVVLPQVFKNVIPEMCNMFLTNLKMTSVLNVIGVSELFLTAKTVAGNYYKYYEAYLTIGVIYFVLCFIFNRLIILIEKKLEGNKDYALAVEYLEND